jgi:hypothetical protein
VKPQPEKEKARLQRQVAAAEPKKRELEKQAIPDGRSRGQAYIPKPEFTEGEKKPVPKSKWKRWVILTAAATLLAVGALEIPHWLQPPSQKEFVLTAADIDQVATATAREALRAGRIPPELAQYPQEVRQRIADGKESLYTKRLLPPEAAEMRVHVTISNRGAVIGEEVLTPEHPTGQSFPAGPDSPVQFHFTVEEPGPSHQVTCWVNSTSSASTHTKAMGQGESDDLQARAQ